MLKWTLTLLLCSIVTIDGFASMSYVGSQELLNRLTRANGMRPIKIEVLNDSDVNAYGGSGHIAVTTGAFRYANQSVMIALLAHELAHARGIRSEVGADRASVRLAKKAGLDVCPGARQFLSTLGLEGDHEHPDGITRLKLMGCTR